MKFTQEKTGPRGVTIFSVAEVGGGDGALDLGTTTISDFTCSRHDSANSIIDLAYVESIMNHHPSPHHNPNSGYNHHPNEVGAHAHQYRQGPPSEAPRGPGRFYGHRSQGDHAEFTNRNRHLDGPPRYGNHPYPHHPPPPYPPHYPPPYQHQPYFPRGQNAAHPMYHAPPPHYAPPHFSTSNPGYRNNISPHRHLHQHPIHSPQQYPIHSHQHAQYPRQDHPYYTTGKRTDTNTKPSPQPQPKRSSSSTSASKGNPPTSSSAPTLLTCAPCTKTFPNAQALEKHLSTHIMCSETGCSFSGTRKVVNVHFEKVHGEYSGQGLKDIEIEGQTFQVLVGDSPDDIMKWRMERRKNWPSRGRITTTGIPVVPVGQPSSPTDVKPLPPPTSSSKKRKHQRSKNKTQKDHHVPLTKKVKPTLLQKLLAAEKKTESLRILELFQLLVQHDFFTPGLSLDLDPVALAPGLGLDDGDAAEKSSSSSSSTVLG